jgi:hypothetical protein
MTIPDRQEAVKELSAEGHSNRAIADILGVNEGTVRNDRAENSVPVFDNTAAGAGLNEGSAENSALEQSLKREDALREQLRIAQAPVAPQPWPLVGPRFEPRRSSGPAGVSRLCRVRRPRSMSPGRGFSGFSKRLSNHLWKRSSG